MLINSMTVMLVGLIIGYADQPKGISLFKITIVFYCIFLFTRVVLILSFYPSISKVRAKKVRAKKI